MVKKTIRKRQAARHFVPLFAYGLPEPSPKEKKEKRESHEFIKYLTDLHAQNMRSIPAQDFNKSQIHLYHKQFIRIDRVLKKTESIPESRVPYKLQTSKI